MKKTKKEILLMIYDVCDAMDEYLDGSCLVDEIMEIADKFAKLKK